MPKLYMVVNEDRFFLSHRKPVALAAVRDGYETVIVTKDTGSLKVIEQLGFKVLDLPINPTGMNILQELKTFGFLFNLYRKGRPDIVHHVGMKNILWGGLASKLLGVKGVVNAVSGLGSLFNGGKISLVNKGVLRVMRFSHSRDGVKDIFQNEDDKRIFLDSKVVRPEQIEFTKGSGIDVKEYAFTPDPETSPVNVIFTARMVKEKGVCDLIEAAEILKPEFEGKVRFWLCGRLTPHKGGIIEEYMREHCDGKYISWLGERSDIKQLLEQSHIMAFPSYYREGVPKSLIEACAIGRPIVTCNSTGCKDVVEDGVNGFLVSPQSPKEIADALKKLIENPELRISMGQASRKKAKEEFTIERVVATHMKIYKELLS